MAVSSESRRHIPQQRREEIISAAVSLFCEKGYEGTTIRDIARAVGVTEGLLYHYFPSKSALIAECWRRRSWHSRAVAIVAGAGDRPVASVLGELIRDHLASLYENGPAFRMHAAEMLRNGELAAMSQHYIQETHAAIAEYVRRKQHAGWIHPDADPDVVAHVILGTNTTFFVVHGTLPRDQWQVHASDLAAKLTQLLVRSLGAHAGAESAAPAPPASGRERRASIEPPAEKES